MMKCDQIKWDGEELLRHFEREEREMQLQAQRWESISRLMADEMLAALAEKRAGLASAASLRVWVEMDDKSHA